MPIFWCQPDNPELEQFLTSALQAELDKRYLNRPDEGSAPYRFFRQRSGLKTCCWMICHRWERYPALKAPCVPCGKEECHSIGNSGTGKTHMAIAIGTCLWGEYSVSVSGTAAGLINGDDRGTKRESAFAYQTVQKNRSLIIDELGACHFWSRRCRIAISVVGNKIWEYEYHHYLNLGFSDWVKVFHDRTLTAAISR